MKKKNQLVGFLLYESYLEALNELPGEEFKEMINAIMKFVQEDIEPEFNKPMMRVIFKSIKPNLEASKNRYLTKSGFERIKEEDCDDCKNVIKTDKQFKIREEWRG